MSKGHGRVQRAIVSSLIKFPHQNSLELAAEVYQCTIPDQKHHQRRSTARALQRLAEEKVVKASPYSSPSRRQCWMLTGPRLRKKSHQKIKQLRVLHSLPAKGEMCEPIT
jgi:hypothetical protein